eukprot:6250894-Prymnesium_polylepis.1
MAGPYRRKRSSRRFCDGDGGPRQRGTASLPIQGARVHSERRVARAGGSERVAQAAVSVSRAQAAASGWPPHE